VDGCGDVGGSELFVELTDETTLGRIIRPPRMLRMCSAHLPAYIYCGVGASAKGASIHHSPDYIQ